MTKFNEELVNHFKAKFLGYMTRDTQDLVEITDRGFEYKGELLVSIDGLLAKVTFPEPKVYTTADVPVLVARVEKLEAEVAKEEPKTETPPVVEVKIEEAPKPVAKKTALRPPRKKK